MIKKGFKKEAVAVFNVKDSGELMINKKKWNEYFSNMLMTKKLNMILENLKKTSNVLCGYIQCKGGGESAQLKSISDAIYRACGIKPIQDTRFRRRNTPGKRGVNKGPVHNKR